MNQLNEFVLPEIIKNLEFNDLLNVSRVNKSFNEIVPDTPLELKDLISKIVFISRVKRGEKINVHNLTICRPNRFLSLLSRINSRENRNTTFDFITTVIETTYLMIQKYKDTIYKPVLIKILENSKVGINEIIETYSYDTCDRYTMNRILDLEYLLEQSNSFNYNYVTGTLL